MASVEQRARRGGTCEERILGGFPRGWGGRHTIASSSAVLRSVSLLLTLRSGHVCLQS